MPNQTYRRDVAIKFLKDLEQPKKDRKLVVSTSNWTSQHLKELQIDVVDFPSRSSDRIIKAMFPCPVKLSTERERYCERVAKSLSIPYNDIACLRQAEIQALLTGKYMSADFGPFYFALATVLESRLAWKPLQTSWYRERSNSSDDGGSDYSDDSAGMTGTSLYQSREKDEAATDHLLVIFLQTLANGLPWPDTRAWAAEFETMQLDLSSICIGGVLRSINDGSLVAKTHRHDGTWGHTDPLLPLCALESKRRVRRSQNATVGVKESLARGKHILGVRAQQVGEMLALLLYRQKVLGKDPADMTLTQRTVFLIAAEQSKIYFLWAQFSVAYIQQILALEDLARTMVMEKQTAVDNQEDNSDHGNLQKEAPDHEERDFNDDDDVKQDDEEHGEHTHLRQHTSPPGFAKTPFFFGQVAVGVKAQQFNEEFF
ncbi:hypothetical protein BDD12DRAFT_900622 [Trichophaea hybrida]|nr:hypothetical protein BDD12DRAFT_900622 [Trichophaea hybrida]